MSVFDFIKKPKAKATATVAVTTQPAAVVPQYVAQPAVVTPVAPVAPVITPVVAQQPVAVVDPSTAARQQYVASLLSQQPAPTVTVKDQKGNTVSAAAAPTVAPAAVVTPVAPVAAPSAVVVAPAPAPVTKVVEVKTDQKPSDEKLPPGAVKQDAPGTAPVSTKGIVGAGTGEVSRQVLLDIMTHMSQRSNKALFVAQGKARELQVPEVDSDHLLHGLLADGEIYKVIVELKVNPQAIEAELTQQYKRGDFKGIPQLSARIKKIVELSLTIARKAGFEFIAPEHLLLAIFEDGEGVGARVLARVGLRQEDLTKKLLSNNPTAPPRVGPDGKMIEAKSSALVDYTIDITAKAQNGELDQVVERAEEIERVIHVLSRRTKNNPALVGEPGVGKTAIVEGLAQKIVSRQVPDILLGKRLLQLDLMSVIAGASHRGEFEQRMKDLIGEVVASAGSIIMFIDELHTIVGAGAGGEGTLDAANFLKPALARGELQLIGATTLTEYRRYIEKDPALERRFQTVLVNEPTEEQSIKMIKAIRSRYENFHKVKIPDAAIESAVRLSKRYVGDRFLPDKAIDLVDEAASAVRLPLLSLPEQISSAEARIAEVRRERDEAQAKNDTVRVKILNNKLAELEPQLEALKSDYDKRKTTTAMEVTEDIIKDVVSRWTGIPVAKLSGSESEKLSHLEQIMHERMIGQDRPVKSVAAAVRRGRAGLKSAKRPIGSFVFLGPTGVGKTELAKTLAEVLFGQEDAMVRFDMTEYMERHEVAKLIGPPPGYVGYEEGGKLTEAVRRKPYSVVLFDEIEKAHPDVFNILLQILDDGRLTDNKSRTISFKNTVVICTSNIGSQQIQDYLLRRPQYMRDGKSPDVVDLVVEAGEQPTRKVPPADVQPHEYANMSPDMVAPQYRGKAANLQEPELTEGYKFEDEIGNDLSHHEYEHVKEIVLQQLRKFFRPELINRFDEVVVFEPLQLRHMKKIVELQLKALGKLMEEQNIGLEVSDAAKEQLVVAGFDPVYGARPLRRAMQQLLENPISELIIASKVKDGDIVKVDYVGESFTFTTDHPKDTKPVVNKAVPPEERSSMRLQKFVCVASGLEFSSVVYPNSTIICPFNPSEKVKKKEPSEKQQWANREKSNGKAGIFAAATQAPVSSQTPAAPKFDEYQQGAAA
jgi:ATP-dependent Clp protease ATP-binding subunit ClpC